MLVGDLAGVVFVHLVAPPEVLAARLLARSGHYMPASCSTANSTTSSRSADAVTWTFDGSMEAIVELVSRGLAARGVIPPA